MGKSKRNCRRTEDEVRIHEKAVKMRKMTDEQLVHYVEDRVEKARSEGFNNGKKSVRKWKKYKGFPCRAADIQNSGDRSCYDQ